MIHDFEAVGIVASDLTVIAEDGLNHIAYKVTDPGKIWVNFGDDWSPEARIEITRQDRFVCTVAKGQWRVICAVDSKRCYVTHMSNLERIGFVCFCPSLPLFIMHEEGQQHIMGMMDHDTDTVQVAAISRKYYERSVREFDAMRRLS